MRKSGKLKEANQEMENEGEAAPAAEKKVRKKSKSPAPVQFYGLIESSVNQDGAVPESVRVISEIVADRKSVLFEKLNLLIEPKVLLLIRGRRVNLQQKTAYRI